MSVSPSSDAALSDRLDHIEEKLDVILLLLERGELGAQVAQGRVPFQASQAVLQYICSGQMIEALREYRSYTGLGLTEAKEAVERIRDSTVEGGSGSNDR